MSLDVPESGLSSETLAKMAGFSREDADAIDEALAEAAASDIVFNASDYNVVGDGATDTSTTLREAVAAASAAGGGEVYLPNGTYMVSRDGGNFYCLHIPDNVTLRGQSRAGTIIKMAAGAAISVRLLYLDGDDTCIENITLDGNKTNQTVNEQRHGIFADGTTRLHLSCVTAKNFTGDGIYLYTNANSTMVLDCYSTANDRNGITLGGGGSDNISIIGGQYTANAAQQVDSEPGGVLSNVTISGGTLIDPLGVSNDYALTISGVSRTVRGNNWSVSDIVVNGSVFVVWTDNVTFTGVRGISPTTDKPHLTVYRKCVGVTSVGCHWRSTANVGTDNMVVFVSGTDNTNGDMASRVSIIGGSVKNDLGAGMGVYISGSEDILVQGVNVEGAGTNTPGYWGIYVRTVLAAFPMRSARVIGNHVKEFGSGAVAFAGSGAATILSADCSHNTFDATTSGVMPIGCSFNVDGTGAVLEASFIGNNATGNPAVISDYPASGVVLIGGNHGGVGIYSVGADPEGSLSAQIGSMAISRVDGTLKTKGSGAGTNTGWVAK